MATFVRAANQFSSLLKEKKQHVSVAKKEILQEKICLNFPSKTERFKHSPLVYCIYLYNSRLVD